MRHNGINSSIMSTVQFAAPPAAGVILYLGPFFVVLSLNVVTAVIGISILIFVKIRPLSSPAGGQEEGFFTNLMAGNETIYFSQQDATQIPGIWVAFLHLREHEQLTKE